MKFTFEDSDIKVQESRPAGRYLVAHPAEGTQGMTGVSTVNDQGSQLAVVWLEQNALVSWAKAVVAQYGEATVPVHCTYCGAEVEEQDTGLWETGEDTADARRYCTDAPDHLHVGEATTCDRCGGRLVAGEGDARYCGPCTDVLADQLDAARDSETLKQITAALASATSANEALTEIIVVMQRNDQIKKNPA